MKCRACKIREVSGLKKTCETCLAKSRQCRTKRIAAGICRNCTTLAEPNQVRCKACIDKDRKRNKLWKLNLKSEVMGHYDGMKCACCEESDIHFLTIDHINGGGREHRRQLGQGATIYSWLKRNDYPIGYQVLCYNCNCAKGFYGVCPHEEKRKNNLTSL